MPNIAFVIVCFLSILFVASSGLAYADSGVNATPEVQGLSTVTSSDVVGTVTETDSGAWSLTYDPPVTTPEIDLYQYSGSGLGFLADFSNVPAITSALQAAGGSIDVGPWLFGLYIIYQINIPSSMLGQTMPPLTTFGGPVTTYGELGDYVSSGSPPIVSPLTPGTVINKGLHSGVLDPDQVQYTTGYSDQYTGISGQQTFSKTVGISTANTIADKSNFKANTNIQFIAQGTGRATRTEDLLIDGAGNTTRTSESILCPFAQQVSTVMPPYCNIAEVGSSMDTTLTSTVTSADTRFVGTDSTYPVVLNYNINAEGIAIGNNQSSPMIGSVSSYLKVHVLEARNATPIKSEDLAYSETSTASGLISHFSKSMSYQSGFNLV